MLGALIQYDCVLKEEGNLETEYPCEHGDRDWGDVSRTQRTPGAPEAGGGRKDPPLEPLEGARPCHTWVQTLAS